MTAAHFVGLDRVVAATDLLLTLQCRLCETLCASDAGLVVTPLPFVLPPFPIMMHWHDRVESDEGHHWLRQLLEQNLRSASILKMSA